MYVIPLDKDDSRTKLARLVAKQTSAFPTLYVEPARGVLQDEWDAFDVHGDYLNTYTTEKLVWLQGKGYQTVLNRFSNERWSFLDVKRKPRKKRTRRGGRKRTGATTRTA